jgi:hypothetical protein
MTQHVRETLFRNDRRRGAALPGWNTPDCRSARRAQQLAYPAKIMRLIAARLQPANSTASYRNRGQLSSSTHTYNNSARVAHAAQLFRIALDF